MSDDKKSANLPTRSTGKDVDDFLAKVAALPARRAGVRGRLMFALDATASREPTWDRACQIQGEMFVQADALGGLDVQLAYYRGFGEFRVTKWIGNASDLVRHMTGVRCLGGHTQIRKILKYAAKESRKRKVDALVFIGDCIEEDADELCHLAGELGLVGVPAFVFHEGGEPIAARIFQQIAKLSGGAYCPFNAASAQQLKELLSAVAVYAAGGRRALEDFGKKHGGAVLQLTHQVKA